MKTCRVSSTSLVPGACVVGQRGRGVLRQDIIANTSTGVHGPGWLYDDALTAVDGDEIIGRITSLPSSGTLVPREDGSFDLLGAPDGTYHLGYDLKINGIFVGSATETITIGAGGSAATITGAGGIPSAEAHGLATINTTGPAAPSIAAITGAGGIPSGEAHGLAAITSYLVNESEPVTLAEAKNAAKVDPSLTVFDANIIGIITAARQMAEHETGREYVRKTRRYNFTDWPASSHVMHVHDAAAVAISYWDGSAWVAMPAEAFGYFEQGLGTSIGPAVGAAWPTLGPVIGGPRVRVAIDAGSETPHTTTPQCVKLYIKALVTHWVDNPSAASDRSTAEVPFLARLLDPERLYN